MKDNPIIAKLSRLAADHKLVPFLGAGCSVGQLRVDWDALTVEMAKAVSIPVTNNEEVAQKYVEARGKDEFCTYLKRRLSVESVVDSRVMTHIAMISLNLGGVYSTNQDNVFEKTTERFGRQFRKIVKLEDLAESRPAEHLYIKYHGDLDDPDSVIFTTQDFDRRIQDVDHFLNIRLRSDLLARSLLFVGYSFRDRNIQSLLKGLKAAFRDKLPPAYLIAYQNSTELEALCQSFGVSVIDPRREIKEAQSNEEAFVQLISQLVSETVVHKTHDELEDMFRPKSPPAIRVATIYDIAALKNTVDRSDFVTGCSHFRGILDQTVIPEDQESTVIELFWKLAEKCSSTEESDEMKAAAFNLRLSNAVNRLEALAAVMATASVRAPGNRPFNLFMPHIRNLPETVRPITAAMAVEAVLSWKREITDQFRNNITDWIESGADIEEFGADTQTYIKQAMDKAWAKFTIYEHPIKRAARLRSSKIKIRTVSELADEFKSLMPKQFGKPYNS